jgi:methyl-accepting chemotaxis protein
MTIVEDLRTTHRSSERPSKASRRPKPTVTGSRPPDEPNRPRRFGNVSVSGKLLSGFGVMGLIMLAVGFVGIRGQMDLAHSAQLLKKNGLDATANLVEYRKHRLIADRLLERAIRTPSRADRSKLFDAIKENESKAAARFASLDDYQLSKAVRDDVDRANNEFKEMSATRNDSLVPALNDNDSVKAQKIAEQLSVGFSSALTTYESAIATNTAENERRADAISSRATSVEQTTFALLVVGLLMAGFLGLGIARLVARPTRHVESILHQVAAGDLRVRSTSGGDDELGRMSNSLNETLQRTQGVVATIGASAASLTSASNSLASNASQVAANVQTAAAGTEEMTASIQEIARNAQEASRVADEAVRLAIESSQMVADLDAASSEIGHAVEMITSIAEQTNLLALNATIEAARAGDAGRGFAVVANEVKELAQNTSTATQSIRSMVDQIQAKSGEARAGIEQITEVIQQINESQITIAGAVEEQTVTTSEMARQLNEAAYGALAISGGVEGDGAGSATDISRMAGELQVAVEQFQF